MVSTSSSHSEVLSGQESAAAMVSSSKETKNTEEDTVLLAKRKRRLEKQARKDQEDGQFGNKRSKKRLVPITALGISSERLQMQRALKESLLDAAPRPDISISLGKVPLHEAYLLQPNKTHRLKRRSRAPSFEEEEKSPRDNTIAKVDVERDFLDALLELRRKEGITEPIAIHLHAKISMVDQFLSSLEGESLLNHSKLLKMIAFLDTSLENYSSREDEKVINPSNT